MGTSSAKRGIGHGVAMVAAVLLLSVLSLSCGNAEDDISEAASAREAVVNETTSSEARQKNGFNYETYDAVLEAYVDDHGLVDYRSLQANRSDLDAFNGSMARLSRKEFDAWTEQERLAFWINAYNSITLERIIDHYPIKKGGLIARFRYPANSIQQIPGVWKELTNTVMGEEITLESIEHDILRVKFREPRIHAAIVCAALSCPPLRNKAFVAERLDEQLDDQSRRFLSKDSRFRIDRAKKRVYLSSILDWFGKDFVGIYNTGGKLSAHSKTEDAALEYVRRYVSDEDAQFILSDNYSVAFLDYDWTLNEK